MPVARPESSDARIIAHVDMDCFYVQAEQRKQPRLRGLPIAVVQYNSWKGGGLIAVSYEARKYGVKRSMRGDEAKKICPAIQLVQVPVSRGKADLKSYRDASSEVVSVLSSRGTCERASIDEVYLDLTDAAETMLAETPPESLENINEEALKSHILGLNCEEEENPREYVREWLCRSGADYRDKLLACGILIVAELRLQVLKETDFTCSAGIAHNKMLAKLASAMNKPAQQTVVPLSCVKGLLDSLPIKKMKQLGGKLGSSLQGDLGVNTVGDLLKFPEEKLQERYGINTGTWLWNIARGISGEEVEQRLLPKSHGSGKTFPGPQALKTISSVLKWLNELCEELSERLFCDLDENKRIAHTLTLHATAYKSSDSESHRKFPSKSCPLRYGAAKIQEDAMTLFHSGLREYLGSYKPSTQRNKGWGITSLSVSASKIVTIPSGTRPIMKYFNGQNSCRLSSEQSQDIMVLEDAPGSPSGSARHLEPNLNDAQNEFGGEDAQNEFGGVDTKSLSHVSLPSLDQPGDVNVINSWVDKNFACSSEKQVEDGFTMEGPLSPSGTPLGSICGSELFKSESRRLSMEECNKDSLSILHRPERKRNPSKVKVCDASSILRFFNRNVPSTSGKQEHLENVLDDATSSSTEKNNNAAKIKRRDESWSYNVGEIDPSVVEELPPEIQEEVCAWFRASKRTNSVKRGSIAHYFLPTKNRE